MEDNIVVSYSLRYMTTTAEWQAYRANPCVNLRNKIAQENRGLSLKVARTLSYTCNEPIEDLQQLCFMGLLKAVERYNPTKGTAFSSFAMPYIRGEVLHYLRDQGSTLKIPRQMREKVAKVKHIQRQMELMGRKMELVEVAAGLGISQADWEQMAALAKFQPLSSLDDENNHIQVATADVDEESWGAAIKQELLEKLAYLPERSREVMVGRFILKHNDRQIAKRLSIEVEQVQALVNQASIYLREALNAS